ncbi:MAG: SGNH/GDSL hydrolase family protein [Kiritimatiellae bacterium]|nr:SGNH/GDSL hydrolase family protein [Kiritimatiellia bacterium]
MDLLKHPDRHAFVHGALELDETDTGTCPMRFTPRQMEEYGKNEGSELRARSAANVSLAFTTDSDSVAIDFVSPRGARNWLFFDLHLKPDLVTVAYGTNDWNFHETADAFRAACSGYLAKLADLVPEARVVVLTPIWRADLDESKTMGPFSLVADIIREESAAHPGIEVVDGLGLVPHTPEYYADQRVHPNDLGFMHYAANLVRHLRERSAGRPRVRGR